MSEPAGTFVRVKAVAHVGRCASAAVVGRALVFRVQGSGGQLGFAFDDGELSLVLSGELFGDERDHLSG
eukprot:4206716-Pleurochrysis_carterae.AAC.1